MFDAVFLCWVPFFPSIDNVQMWDLLYSQCKVDTSSIVLMPLIIEWLGSEGTLKRSSSSNPQLKMLFFSQIVCSISCCICQLCVTQDRASYSCLAWRLCSWCKESGSPHEQLPPAAPMLCRANIVSTSSRHALKSVYFSLLGQWLIF